MILALRLLPFILGLLEAWIFWFQHSHADLYPWLAILGLMLYPVAVATIAWKRLPWREVTVKMLPTFLLLGCLAFGLLLAEGGWAMFAIVILAGVATTLSLELLFLLAFHPTAYPVNGLSHLNLVFFPLMLWYAASTSSGLLLFLHTSRWWHVILVFALSSLVFRATSHPGATRRQKRIWTLIGGLVGFEVGCIGLMLPVSMAMQGILAALVCSASLRVRRYLYAPRPSARLAWSEAVLACVLFTASLVTAKWL